LTEESELRQNILESLAGAVSNGYAATLLTWTDEEIAEDMQSYASDLEDAEVEAMVPHIAEWRRSMADKEIPGGEDDGGDGGFGERLSEMLESGGAAIAGPFRLGSGGGLFQQLMSGGQRQSEKPASDEARQIDLMLEASENLGGLLNADRLDSYVPTERTSASIPGAHAPAFAICDEHAKGTDQHVYVLHRDEDTSLKWRLWSLCPNVELATPVILFGDEKRALHRANILIDLANDRLDRKEFYALATGKPVPGAASKKAKPAPDQKAH
jgi:hypothetical protein